MAKKLYGTDPDQVPTNADLGTIAYQDSENVNLVKDSGAALTINRKTSDGDIMQFRKDGSTVGSIGVESSAAYFAGVTYGIKPYSAGIAASNSSGVFADGTADLGKSDIRWKDLYLSGGVYLGGTVAANHLDDYEEGLYETAITASGSGTVTLSSNNDLSYVKVGDIVHVQGFISVSSVSSPTGFFKINLPFTAKTGLAYRAAASVSLNGVSSNNVADFWAIVDDNTNHIQVYLGDGSSVQTDSAQQLQTGADCRLQVTYQAA